MQTRKDDGVFPLIDSDGEFLNTDFGLTKREYFASAILQGMISSGNFLIVDSPKKAVAIADELIKALNTPHE